MLRRSLGWLCVCALLLSVTLTAQQNATLQGIVADDQKAVMPGVTVTAIETKTGRQSVEVTTADGRYQFENLPPGEYKLRIELSGFATAEITGIELLVGANATVPPIDHAPGGRAGDGGRQLAGAARGRDVGARQRQHRPPSDGGAAAAGPQLDGAVADGEGDHGEQHRQHARRPRRSVSAQSRRPADLAAHLRLGLRAAEDEPRGDRRVPDRHQHV